MTAGETPCVRINKIPLRRLLRIFNCNDIMPGQVESYRLIMDQRT